MENSLLIVAKAEYTNQLQEILSKYIHQGIQTLWENVKKTEKKSLLKRFQEKLCFIPNWNQEIIEKEYTRITKTVSKDYLDKLLEAVFLSNVKILSVVKLSNHSKKIDVNVPDTKHFIHKCYIETAREFYSDPYLIEDRATHIAPENFHTNYKKRFTVIYAAIEKTIRKTIPMEDILNKYLSVDQDFPEIPVENDVIQEETDIPNPFDGNFFGESGETEETQDTEPQQNDELFMRPPENIEEDNQPIQQDFNSPQSNQQSTPQHNSIHVIPFQSNPQQFQQNSQPIQQPQQNPQQFQQQPQKPNEPNNQEFFSDEE